MIKLQGKYAYADIMIDTVEPECIAQIYDFLNHPLYEGSKIVIQADTHGGKGSVIGFTATLNGKGICSNVVGVDIACGMNLWPIAEPNDYAEFDKAVRSAVPLGANIHKSPIATMEKDFPWKEVNKDVLHFVQRFNKKFDTQYFPSEMNYGWFESFAEKLKNTGQVSHDFIERVNCSIGSMGSGNHFCEIDVDENGQHYLVIHSGSRNVGQRIAMYYQKLAEGQEHNREYNKDLAYLKGQDMIDYLTAMVVMRHFASMNRRIMGEQISKATGILLGALTETIHNYIDDRDFIIRKGAIRSYEGEQMIIPFNMRDGSWIVEGKSKPDFNFSAPHGAGRLMSRTQAKRTLKLEEFINTMEGVFSTSVCLETLDEAPEAYKPADIIKAEIIDTAKLIHKLIPVYNLKCTDESFFVRKKKKLTNPGDNSPDAVWLRVKETLSENTVSVDNEANLRAEFETAPREFCKKHRK
jgi:RNA-splicing ligase RtcB